MTCGQRGQLHGTISEQRVGNDQQCVGSLSHRVAKAGLDRAGSGMRSTSCCPMAEATDCTSVIADGVLRIIGVDQNRKAGVAVQELVQKPELLCRKPHESGTDTGNVAAWSIEADDETSLDRVDADHEHDRNDGGRGLGSESRG